MTSELLPALAAFAFVTSITPGPNNFMLMSSGARFGLRRTVPHMLGISAGFGLMVLMVGLGVMQIFETWPLAERVLKTLCVAFLAYLTWKIASAGPIRENSPHEGVPMTFVGAALFQWVNPKAWAMALSAVSLYAPGRTATAVGVVAVVFTVVNLPSVGVWAYAGEKLRQVLTSAARQRAFNLTMAALLALSVLPML